MPAAPVAKIVAGGPTCDRDTVNLFFAPQRGAPVGGDLGVYLAMQLIEARHDGVALRYEDVERLGQELVGPVDARGFDGDCGGGLVPNAGGGTMRDRTDR